MPSIASLAQAAVLLASTASAHFTLNTPATAGFDEDKEATGPCGGFTPDFSTGNVTSFHVGGDFIYTTLYHPQASFLYRATLDTTGSSNWTEITPTVQQSGLGDYCEQVAIPSSWAGQKGVVGVACDSPDGLLFQCAAVNFVTGTGTAGSCKNGSSVTGAFTADATLATLVSTTATSTASTNGTSSSSSAATTSAAKGAAVATGPGASALGSMAVASVMLLVGTLLL